MDIPFMSKESVRALVAAKDETIATQKAEIEHLRETIEAERRDSRLFAATALETLKPAAPVQPVRRERPHTDELPPSVPIDLSLVDPDDNEALMFIARQEIPPGSRVTGSSLLRKVEHIRQQVIEAHEQRRVNASQPVLVPERVASRIEAAERAGAEQAKGA